MGRLIKSNKKNITFGMGGQMVIEVLVAFGLASVLLPAILTGFISSRDGKVQQQQRLIALGYLQEEVEGLRSVREGGWSNISVNNTYHVVQSGNGWTLATGSETVGDFTKSILIENIAPADPSIKKITATVSWNSAIPSSVSSIFYLSRFLGNRTFTQTTQAEFNAGTKTGVSVTNISGGEIQLGAGGKADWCEPALTIAAIDLPKSGVANAITTIEGKVFAGTGDNSSGVSFADVTITNTDPPTGSINATFDGYKTNGVFGEANYAYLATDNNSKEIVAINLNQIVAGKYQEAGSFNAPGNGNGNSVFVSGNYGYMTGSSGNKFYNFNRPGASFPLDSDGVTLDNVGNKTYVVSNYAYIATNGSTNQLNIVDISSPTNLTKITSFTVDGLAAKDVYVNATGTRAYLVTANSATKKEFFIIDISNKSSPVVVGSYDTNGMDPKGVTVVTGNKAITVGTGGSQQYQIIDIADESNPVHCTSGGRSGGLAISTGVNGVSSVVEQDGDVYSYIITGDASSELKIIEGGPGGKYSTNGVFESSTFDAGSEAAYNRITSNFAVPNQTTLRYQVSGLDKNLGVCPSTGYTFVGPDGTDQTFFTSLSSQIPLSDDGLNYENPAACFRYKLFLDSNDQSSTPVFSDTTVNYSP